MSWDDHLRRELRELPESSATSPAVRPEVVHLDCNEAPFPLEEEELAELHSVLGQLSLQRYPEPSGASLRRLLAERWRVDPAQILLGNGSVEVLALLATAMVGSETRPARLLYPDPSFPYYEVIARTHGFSPLPVPPEPDFQIDAQRFAQTIALHRPVLAFFASPNNPSGNLFDRRVLLRLAERMDAAFVVDEAYVELSDEGAANSLIPQVRGARGLFVTRTLSKLGFAGLRVGALVGPAEAIAQLDKVRPPWNVNAASLAFAQVLLSRPERIDRRIAALRTLRRSFEAMLRCLPGLAVFPSQANFVLVRATPFSARALFERLLARGVLVKNVARPGLLEGCLRITVGTAAQTSAARACCVKSSRTRGRDDPERHEPYTGLGVK